MAPTGLEVITYEVIAAPPLSAGVVNVTVILLPLVTATTSDGADGVVEGVAALLADDFSELPTVVTASTLNVYADPLSSPVTTQLLWPDVGSQVPASFPWES